MYWILAAVFIVIALAVPRLRPLGIAGCIVLAALLAWAVTQRARDEEPARSETVQERRQPVSPASPTQSVPLKAVAVEDLTLSGSGAPFDFSGRIVNNTAELLLKSVTIVLTRRDCYEGALDPSGCTVLWEDRRWIDVSVPPQQSREFSVSIWMRGSAPRARGAVRDTFEVVAASGEAIAVGGRR